MTPRPVSPAPDRPPARPTEALWLCAAYVLLGLALPWLDRESRGLALNALNTVVFTHAGILSLGRAGREPSASTGWRLFGAGLLAQAFNQALASLHMVQHAAPPPFPDWGDLSSVLSLALMLGGLLAFPLASASGSERIRKGLDGLGAALAIFAASWFFALGPLFHRPGSMPQERGAMAIFFLGNATILGLCAYLGARQATRFQGPLGWITAGFSVSILQVMLQVPLTLAGEYRLGDPLDLLVLIAALLIFQAPLAPRPLEPGTRPSAEIRDTSWMALVLPMLPAGLGLAAVLAGLAFAPARLDPPLLLLVTALAALGLLRGLLALRDLQRLSTALESRVLERTAALESMQQATLRTERMNTIAVLGAGLAHDLNNALTAVRARAELARERAAAGSSPDLSDLDQILLAADRSAALTQRLMSFDQADQALLTEIPLQGELRALEPSLRMLLGTEVHLGLELGDQPLRIRGSRSQLEQILVNLVANARDAMPQGGRITLRLDREEPAMARVVVEDTGSGMPAEVQARIFDPFFTTKAPGRGTGLGLTSVRQLVHQLGGTVAVASEPGRGTTFTLRIPLA